MTDSLILREQIAQSIRVVRGQKVLLDADLAALYGVETKGLVRAVNRNRERFPGDFMFQLSIAEHANLRYQSGTSSSWGGRRVSPYAFTEQGVAMLSSVLRSPRAVVVNVEIVRAFVELRRAVESTAGLSRKLDALERKYDGQFQSVFEATPTDGSTTTTGAEDRLQVAMREGIALLSSAVTSRPATRVESTAGRS